ncbi:putative reverse transcriptase domain-containing protein [Tanacetum coccineum]
MRIRSPYRLLGLPSGFPLGMIPPKNFDKRNRLVPHDSVLTSKEDLEVHLKLVLELLKKERLFAKISKCEFWLQEVHFLGHLANSNDNHVDPSKIEAVKNWKALKTPQRSDHFLDWQKKQKYEWGVEQEEAFQTLKENLCNTPILSLPDGTNDFVVYYDASNQGFGCVLMQRSKFTGKLTRVNLKNVIGRVLTSDFD